MSPDEYSESIPGAPLEAVICVNELHRRPCRSPNRQLEDAALKELLQGMTSSPDSVLQSLTDTIRNVLQCDSAGVSLINDEATRFYWPAISGVWKPHIGGGTPIHFGPCGDVLRLNKSLHMHHVHRRYTYFSAVPLVNEALLVPFYVDDVLTGTLWSVLHEPPHNERSQSRYSPRFDGEDMRMLESLARFATAAYEVWMKVSKKHRAESVL